jgi:hypothetical protein
MITNAFEPTERPIEPFRTFLFVPKHEVECLAAIVHLWMEGAATVAIKQAQVAHTAMQAGSRVAQESARALSELYVETSRAVYRAMNQSGCRATPVDRMGFRPGLAQPAACRAGREPARELRESCPSGESRVAIDDRGARARIVPD